MRITREQYDAILRRPAIAEVNPPGYLPSRSQPERPLRHAPHEPEEGAQAHPAGALVRIVSFRHRLLDPDNLCGKYFVDALRYSGLIADDSAREIEYSIRQVKVENAMQERTEVTIETL